ncbi:ATP-binding cassette subfamily C protein/ATP-binding cassette subfamily C protein CydC [Actinomadura pelletieri DSM 43383]|uniref:ATP-binding cassette subfamily C protein/ATP-binding cassette subfamily C protein CydC n=1 Tax=Actinomadura pelletieri DSM 43383 TaxID=1120940 RepID=A0A495QM24_9ACTN|nr:thiol reductant ABC exporter subunit CydC [Actinomadura pelletieri]RKS73538.1 ATP-binding cassette subfamily C protein/ATP-binding cassette subfamily C protein CydC [Actinomadura pelletieri DSM 43383]
MWGAVRPHAWRLVAAGLAGAAAELCGLGLVAAAAWLIARAAQQPELAALSVAIAAVRGLALAKGSLRYVERLAGHDAALRALAELRGRVFDALAAAPPPSSPPPASRSGGRSGGRSGVRDGDALTRMVSDVEAVQDVLLRCALPAVAAVACGAAGVVVCGLVWAPAAVVLAGGLLVAGVVVPVAAATAGGRAAARVAAGRRALAVRALDVVEGAADLAMFGASERFAARAGDAARRLERAERSAARVSALVTAAGHVVQGATVAVVLWAASRAGAGVDEVDAAVLALTALVAVESVSPLAAAARRLREVWPSVRRVQAVLAAPPAPGPAPARASRGPLEVELLGVRVSYGAGRALDGVDLRVERGRRVAVVGASGAGKSTLLAAVAGDVAVEAGAVVVGGRTVDRDRPGEVRGLLQDAHVFAGTVRANLLLACPDADEERLRAAAGRARFLEVVESLPDGWDTVVGAGGRGLSGGQRQRLLLARALLADPPVLVLDEPTEALDPALADAVVEELLTRPGGGTLLLVTHRLAALGAADEVVVLDRGRVVQRGRHEDLLTVPGAYRDLWDAETLAAGTL